MKNKINVDGKKWNPDYVREHGSEEEFVSKYLGEDHKHIYASHRPEKRESAFRMVWKLATADTEQPAQEGAHEEVPPPPGADSGSEEPGRRKKRTPSTE